MNKIKQKLRYFWLMFWHNGVRRLCYKYIKGRTLTPKGVRFADYIVDVLLYGREAETYEEEMFEKRMYQRMGIRDEYITKETRTRMAARMFVALMPLLPSDYKVKLKKENA